MPIITITGTPSSGKSTLAKLLAKRLGYKHYSMGDLQRKLAAERGVSINELVRTNIDDKHGTDAYVDDYQTALGKKEDDFVLDGRISFHFLPRSIKLFVDADEKVRAERLLNRDAVVENAKSLAHAEEMNRERAGHDRTNFTRRYGVDPYARQNYDLVLDSTRDSPEELARQVLERFPELRPKR